MVIAVFIHRGRLIRWEPLSMGFDEAVQHYHDKAQQADSEWGHSLLDPPPLSLPPGVTVVWPQSRSIGR